MQRMEGELARTIEKHLPTHRPYPARRQSRPQRAGHRRNQLRLPVPAARRARLRRLDRLRIQARTDDRWTALAGSLAPPSAIDTSTTEETHTWRKSDSSASASWARRWPAICSTAGHELCLYSRVASRAGRSPRAAQRRAIGQGSRRERRHHHHHGARHAGRRGRAVRRGRRRRGPRARQDRRRHELDLADRDQGLRQAHQRARLRLSRRAGVGRRGRRQGGDAHDHGAAARRRPSTRSSRCSS